MGRVVWASTHGAQVPASATRTGINRCGMVLFHLVGALVYLLELLIPPFLPHLDVIGADNYRHLLGLFLVIATVRVCRGERMAVFHGAHDFDIGAAVVLDLP